MELNIQKNNVIIEELEKRYVDAKNNTEAAMNVINRHGLKKELGRAYNGKLTMKK